MTDPGSMFFSTIFGGAFQRSLAVIDIPSSSIQTVSFPGGYNVSTVEGVHLLDEEVANDDTWYALRLDLFISAEEALVSLLTVSDHMKEFLTVDSLVNTPTLRTPPQIHSTTHSVKTLVSASQSL